MNCAKLRQLATTGLNKVFRKFTHWHLWEEHLLGKSFEKNYERNNSTPHDAVLTFISIIFALHQALTH